MSAPPAAVRSRMSAAWRSPNAKDGLLTVALLAASVAPLLLAPVRARWLGPDDRGTFALFQSSIALVAAASMLGIRHAAYSFGPEGPRRLPMPVLACSLLAGLLAAAPLALLALHRGQQAIATVLVFSVVLAPLWASYQLEVADAGMTRDRRGLAALTSGPPLVDLLLTGVLVLARTLTLTATVAVALAVELARALVTVVRSWRRRGPTTIRRYPGGQFVREALTHTPGSLLPQVAMHVDIVVYAALVPSALLGIYAVSRIGMLLVVPVTLALEGRVVRMAQERGVRRAVLFSAAVGAGLLVLVAPPGALLIPTVFGEEYAAAAVAFVAMMAAGAIRCFTTLVAASAAGLGMAAPASVQAGVHLLAAAAAAAAVAALPGTPVVELMAAGTLVAQTIGSAAMLITLRRSRRL